MACMNLQEHILCILPYPEPTSVLVRLRQKFPNTEVTFITAGTSDDGFAGTAALPKGIFKDATILVTLWALPPTVADAPFLKHIHLCCAGADHVAQHPVARHASVVLTTSSGIHGPQIAEWVIMTALVHAHKYDALYELQKSQTWGSHDDFRGVADMVGQRIGILGYGSIGRQVGRVAKAMGMDVVAFTPTARQTVEDKKSFTYVIPGTGDPDGTIPSRWYSGLHKSSIREFLARDLDILVISLPLTDQTRHLLSHEEFELLGRRRAFVSNISRGGVIDQTALIAALHANKLRGAALDVADPEPLPPGHPLWQAPNVIITPHLSGLVHNYVERAFEVLETNLDRMLEGQQLLNIIKWPSAVNRSSP